MKRKKILKWFKLFLWIIWGGLSTAAQAQFRDDFSAGLNKWRGDKMYFECLEGSLCSKGPDKSCRMEICRRSRLFDSAFSLEYGLDLKFVPSTANFLRLYLVCADTALQDTSRAVYLHLGQKGNQNFWQLWQSGPDTSALLWQGGTLFGKQSQMKMRVRAVFSPRHFSLYYTFQDGAAVRWTLDGDSLDFASEGLPVGLGENFYTGPVCSYKTASRASMYCFTHVYVDTVPDFNTVPEEEDNDIFDSVSFSVPAYGSVVINEVMFEPAPGESRYVELYNTSDSMFEMRHWALAVSSDGEDGWKYYRLCVDDGCVIAPFSYAVPAKDANKTALGSVQPCRENIFTAKSFPALDAHRGFIRLVWIRPDSSDSSGGFGGGGGTGGDTVVLDEIFYSEEYHHWLIKDTKGVALERLNPHTSGLEADSWASAAETAGFATPGCENSHTASADGLDGSTEDYFVLTHPLVTPNNDGINDFTFIEWNPKLDGYACSMSVYDDKGRCLNRLCDKKILGAGGRLRYDAADAGGRILRPGIYVLLVELIKPNGKIKRLRYAFAVS